MVTAAIAAAMTLTAGHAVNASTVGGNYVVNGDFEDTTGLSFNSRGWNQFASIPGWDTYRNRGIEVQSDATLGYIDAESGDYYVELDTNRNNTIFQDIYLEAGEYRLTFQYSPRTTSTIDNDMKYFVGSALSGNIVGAPSEDYPRGEWTEVTERFTVAVGDTYRLRFKATGTSNSLGALVDTVSIAAVPLPASALMLLAGVGAIGAMKRRRKA